VTFDPDHPFFEHELVFTGGMMSMTRHDAQQAVVDVGGRPMTSVGKKADFVVVGGEFYGLLAGYQHSQKLARHWSSGRRARTSNSSTKWRS
jgi:DNA polymerase-3 subunit epsilon